MVLWGLPAFLLASSEGASRLRNGNARGRLLQDSGNSTIRHIHFSPQHLTTTLWVERTASRYLPLALIFLPLRRSIVSSITTNNGMPAFSANITSIPSRIFAPCSPLHLARLNTRWYWQNVRFPCNPITRNIAATVCGPGTVSRLSTKLARGSIPVWKTVVQQPTKTL